MDPLEGLTPPEPDPTPVEPVEPAPVAVEPEPPAEPTPAPNEPEPVAAAPDPEPEPTLEPVAAVSVTVQPDEMDKQFEEAIGAIDSDEMLSEGQKRAEKLRLQTAREERQERRQRAAIDNEERHRNLEATKHGVPRSAIDLAWDAACRDSAKLMGRHDYGAAVVLYHQNIAKAKGAKTAVPVTVAPSTPATAKPPVTPGGGSVLPKVNRHSPPPPSKEAAAEKVFRELGPVAGWKV